MMFLHYLKFTKPHQFGAKGWIPDSRFSCTAVRLILLFPNLYFYKKYLLFVKNIEI